MQKEELTEKQQFCRLTLKTGTKSKMSVTFRPAALVTIDAWSQLTSMAHARVVEEAVCGMLTVFLLADQSGKKLWEDRFQACFRMILLAA